MMLDVSLTGGGVVAADDLPGPVVTFLNVIGVQWPYINVRHEARCFLGEV